MIICSIDCRTFELLAHRQFAGTAIFILEFFNKSFVIRTITKAQKWNRHKFYIFSFTVKNCSKNFLKNYKLFLRDENPMFFQNFKFRKFFNIYDSEFWEMKLWIFLQTLPFENPKKFWKKALWLCFFIAVYCVHRSTETRCNVLLVACGIT